MQSTATDWCERLVNHFSHCYSSFHLPFFLSFSLSLSLSLFLSIFIWNKKSTSNTLAGWHCFISPFSSGGNSYQFPSCRGNEQHWSNPAAAATASVCVVRFDFDVAVVLLYPNVCMQRAVSTPVQVLLTFFPSFYSATNLSLLPDSLPYVTGVRLAVVGRTVSYTYLRGVLLWSISMQVKRQNATSGSDGKGRASPYCRFKGAPTLARCFVSGGVLFLYKIFISLPEGSAVAGLFCSVSK